MKKTNYKKPYMKVYPLVLNEPILVGSYPGADLGKDDPDKDDGGN